MGLYLFKSIEAVAAIFGILKAGAVYVPIDPDSPLQRTRHIIANAHIEAIVVDEPKLHKLLKNRELFPPNWFLLNISRSQKPVADAPDSWRIGNRAEIEKEPAKLAAVEPRAETDPAYILYTSGSTGQPKGVMLTHQNGAVFIDWAASYLDLGPDDVFSSHAPLHFDLSIFDLFVSLKQGGTLCLIPPGISYFADAILKFISQNGITVWYSVPSALTQWLALKREIKTELQSIKSLIYAGEVFPYPYLNRLRKALPHARIYNFYGPTETNVIAYYPIELQADEALQANVPIGVPCPYARIFIVDENKKPVPKGVLGELIVNGPSLMAGYWGDPQKNAAAIQALNQADGEKFYFTGDMVMEQEDGRMIYVNRRDNMVKIRGFRVELGEVETALYKHPLIQKAAVIAVADEEIGQRLAAFIVLQESAVLSPGEVMTHCEQFLPAYMLPEKIIFLTQLPLTANGKIDREKLKSIPS